MNLFNYVKSQLSILDVISEYSTLKKAGLYWKGHCPFHNEKTASFTVSPHREIFYCFGCHEGGDIISFIEKVENCSPIQAANYLVDKYKINVPTSILHESKDTHSAHRDRYYDLCKAMSQWCHESLLKNATVMNYLTKRSFTKESIENYGIGYFPGGLATIKQLLANMGTLNFLPNDLIEANILSEGRTVLYSPFEERIIFPIKDHLGRYCGFGGRVFKEHDERPKYYNSRENDYFSKGSLLFGLDTAKKEIQKREHVFLVEGYTDCIAMAQYGFGNTVATLGTACTLEHLKQLARYAQHLYVVYDGDSAGEAAIIRIAELCWQVSLELKVIRLPAKEDPASYLAAGNKLEPLMTNAHDIFFFFIDNLGQDFNLKPLSEKIAQIRKFIGVIINIDDPLKKDILLQRASKTFEIPVDALNQEYDRIYDRQQTALENKEEYAQEKEGHDSGETSAEPSSKLEKKIICAIINNIQLFNNSNEKYLLEYLPSPLRGILERLKLLKDEIPQVDFIQFFDKLNEYEKKYVSKLLLESAENSQEETFEQLLVQLHKKNWKVIVHDIKLKLAQAKNEGDQVKVAKLLQDFLELKQKMLKKDFI